MTTISIVGRSISPILSIYPNELFVSTPGLRFAIYFVVPELGLLCRDSTQCSGQLLDINHLYFVYLQVICLVMKSNFVIKFDFSFSASFP